MSLREKLKEVETDPIATAKLLDRVKEDSEDSDHQILVKHTIEKVEQRVTDQIKAYDGTADNRLQLYAGYLQCLEILKGALFVTAKDQGFFDGYDDEADEESTDGE